jgi:phage tail-like protein
VPELVPELVQAFRFRVRLTRTALPGRTGRPPPDLQADPDAATPPAGGRRAPVESTAVTSPPGDPRTPPPDQLGDGGFAECTGLDLEAEVRDLTEGGRNDGVIRRVGRVKPSTITLKRGMFVPAENGRADGALWEWLGGMVSGALPVPRYDGHVEVLDPTGQRVVAHWSFARGLPLKVTGPALNAKTGEVAVEELQIAHEGLRLESR